MVDAHSTGTPESRYIALIEQVVDRTLKGEIRSKEQVFQMLRAEVEPSEAGLFAASLQTQVEAVESALANAEDALKQAKASRQQRALKTLQGEFDRWQREAEATGALSGAIAALMQTQGRDRLTTLLTTLDPNQPTPLTREQVLTLAQQLQLLGANDPHQPALLDMALGMRQGLNTWKALEGQVVQWIYEQGGQSLGFGQEARQGPWGVWAKQVPTAAIHPILLDLATHQQITAAGIPTPLLPSTWVELAIALPRLQRGLVAWFDQQPYDLKAGKRLSIATFLTFAVVWGQISRRLSELGQSLWAEGCFQMVMQVLRHFAQKDYFPLYGGLFTALSGESLRTLLEYLEQPLETIPNTDVKARVLTLLGYSQRALGQTAQARRFHEAALTSAQAVQDIRCEIANLNHLSRTALQEEALAEAIAYSQRALIQSRQSGDTLGEANALTNLGHSEIAQAQADPRAAADLETVLGYLEQGLRLTQQVRDRPSEALCANSMGIALILLRRYEAAIPALEHGLHTAQMIGDPSLEGSNHSHLAIAHQQLDQASIAIFHAAMGMYLLWQLDSMQWIHPARTLNILAGQVGDIAFQATLEEHRSAFWQRIGVDGYDYLPQLLRQYRESLSS